MMNKIKSARLHLVKFLFILPLMAVLLLAFRDQYKEIFRRTGEVYINEAGIIVDMATRKPLIGVTVMEKFSGLTATTDAKGFYRLRIPVSSDSVRIRLAYVKEGYDSSRNEYFFPSVKESRGLIDVYMLHAKGGQYPFMMIAPYFSKVPFAADPTYKDALYVLEKTIRDTEDWNVFFTMTKAHPEVALFYSAEGNVRHIVIRKDGQVEKYGAPGDLSMEEMEKKYGPLSAVITAKSSQVGASYLSRWKKISEEAEKEFHTTNPDALHIIFPGDSRVLVVPVSGKPEIYDMENEDPKERPSFETLYGKLPDCVPNPTLSTRTGKLATPPSRGGTSSPARTSSRVDTVPKNTGAVPDSAAGRRVTISSGKIPANILYVVDGKPMEAGWKGDTIPPGNIASINIIKNKEAMNLYGERGANGVIVITTKPYLKTISIRPVDPEDPLHRPLYVVDGMVTSQNALNTLNPDRIQSIEVFKDSSSRRIYGENAKNGVVLIHTKPIAATPIRPRVDSAGRL